MRLQKIILCAAALLTAFGTSIGIVAVGKKSALLFAPFKPDISSIESVTVKDFQPITIESETPKKAEEKYVHRDFKKVGEDGYYYIIGTPKIDNLPRGFKDFEYFNLYREGFYNAIKEFSDEIPQGSVVLKNDLFRFAKLTVTDNKISFTTEKQKGISYRFEGNFTDETITVKDSYGKDYTDTIAVKGTLTKYKNGVKIAEAFVNFGFTVGC